jgi:hypothetical protein
MEERHQVSERKTVGSLLVEGSSGRRFGGEVMMKKMLVGIAIGLAVLFAVLVYPTQYRYDVMHVGSSMVNIRTNRFTGNVDRLVLDKGWVAMAPPALDLSPGFVLTTPATPPDNFDRPAVATPNPPAVITPDHLKKAKPVPVFGYATVSTYDEDIYQRCAFNTGSTPCLMIDGPENDFSGRLATLNKDDRVEILSAKVRAPNGKEIYKVRFQQWTGWMDASSLTLEAQ